MPMEDEEVDGSVGAASADDDGKIVKRKSEIFHRHIDDDAGPFFCCGGPVMLYSCRECNQ